MTAEEGEVTASTVRDDVSPDITDDSFLGGNVFITQPMRGYRAGLDAVLLAAAAPVPPHVTSEILDAGSGVGTVGLCIARRCPAARVTLLERERPLADLARGNIARNDLGARVHVVEADLSQGGSLAQGHARHPDLHPAMFDHVVANPPYRITGTGTAPPGLKAKAHQLGPGDLDRWIAAFATLSRKGASLTIVHEPSALPALLSALDGRYGALAVLPVLSRSASPAVRIIVQARKASRAPLTLLAPLVLHGHGNAFTAEVDAILRLGAALPLGRPESR